MTSSSAKECWVPARAQWHHRSLRLQFEVERAAETFAQSKSPRAIYPRAKRRVHDQLHAARLIEKPLDHNVPLRREQAEDLVGCEKIIG
jgi:hypothetical protein